MALLSQTERPSTVTLLESLLDAIVRLDGEALIMHVGEKPYMVLSSTSTNTLRGPCRGARWSCRRARSVLMQF